MHECVRTRARVYVFASAYGLDTSSSIGQVVAAGQNNRHSHRSSSTKFTNGAAVGDLVTEGRDDIATVITAARGVRSWHGGGKRRLVTQRGSGATYYDHHRDDEHGRAILVTDLREPAQASKRHR